LVGASSDPQSLNGANQKKLRRIRKHAARLAQLYAHEPPR
jgi:hypothetical protein